MLSGASHVAVNANCRFSVPRLTGETTSEPDVMDYLSSEQQETLVQEEMNRQAWWEEVLPQLLPPSLSSDSGAGTGETFQATPAPETKVFEGDGPLIEE